MTENIPKVSVIIPTYNRAKFIGRALDSVLGQTFTDYEVIVVDDGSTDGTREVLEAAYDGKIKYIYQKNGGVSAARNRGISEARGTYVAFLDSDDFWVPEKLAEQVEILDNHPRVGIVYARMPILNDRAQIIGWKPAGVSGRNFKELLEVWGDLPTSTVMTRMECFHRAGVFDTDLPTMEDIDMWIRISRFYDIYEIEKTVLAYYSRHERQTTMDRIKTYRGLLSVYEKVLREFAADVRVDVMRERIAFSEYMLSRAYYNQGMPDQALVHLSRTIRSYPYIGLLLVPQTPSSLKKGIAIGKPYAFWLVCFLRSLGKIDSGRPQKAAGRRTIADDHRWLQKAPGGQDTTSAKIIIDVNPILKDEVTGIGVYTLNLVKYLCQRQDIPQNIVPFYNKNLEGYFANYEGVLPSILHRAHDRIAYRIFTGAEIGRFSRRIYDLLIYGRMKSLGGKAVFHGTSFFLPRLPKNVKKVVTIHDLFFLRGQDAEIPYIRDRMRAITEFSCHSADRIIAVSRATKADILEFFKVDEKKIEVIYEGVDEWWGQTDTPYFNRAEFARKHRLPEKFILFVGATNRRKNLLTLVRAIAKLKRTDIHLLVVGKPGNQHTEILQCVKANGLNDRINFYGYCPDEELKGLYKSALAFTFPSLYEGFGLPVLEAMACGVPVITSNSSSLKELFASTALLVNPLAEDELARAIERVADDPGLRAELIAAGIKLSGKYSWKKMADETMDLYNRILAED